ncbi:MAG: insulinase family protein, partial [Deltaproteobacteria bacterium]|nr:insulinase family protein [Deltaproteobacteria bacterium]
VHARASAMVVAGDNANQLAERVRGLGSKQLLAAAERVGLGWLDRRRDAPEWARVLGRAALRGEPVAEPVDAARAAACIVGASLPPAAPRAVAKAPPRRRVPNKIVEVSTESGVRVLLERRRGSSTVAVRAAWSGGLASEPGSEAGLHHLMAASILAGCKQRNTRAVADRLAATGGSLKGVAGRHSFGLVGRWPSPGAAAGLELLADCILEPRFEQVGVEGRKRRLVADLRRQTSDDGVRAHRLALVNLFPGHALGRHVAGRVETIDPLTSHSLAARYRQLYPTSRLVVAIVGDFDTERVRKWARRRFAQPMAATKAPAPAAAKPARPGQFFEAGADSGTAQLVIGFRTEGVEGKHRLALELLASTLERPGGPLYRRLRSSGTAYHLGAASVPGSGNGYLAVSVESETGRAGDVAATVRAVIVGLAANGPAAAELAGARKTLIARHLATRDSLVRSAAALALHEVYGLGYRQFLDYPRLLRKVGLTQVKDAAREYLAWDRAVIQTVSKMPMTPAAERRARGRRKRPPKRRR